MTLQVWVDYCFVHVVSVLCLNVVQTGSSSLRASHASSSSVSTQRSASMEERYTPVRQVRNVTNYVKMHLNVSHAVWLGLFQLLTL